MAKETYVNVRKNRFTQVSNGVLWNEKLTLQAKGLMAIFLSNDAGWELHMKEIMTRSRNGRDAHYTVINELISEGYFARVEVREDHRFVEMIYIFSDEPADVLEALLPYRNNPRYLINLDKRKKKEKKEDLFPEKPETGNTDQKLFPDFPETEIPYTESQDNNNTKGNNTIFNNTNLKESEAVSLSIDDELNQEEYLPMAVKKQLSLNQKRLTDDKIAITEIVTFYQSTENTLHDADFAMVVSNVLMKTKGRINNFHSVMRKAIVNWREEYAGVGEPEIDVEESLPDDMFMTAEELRQRRK